jgi:transmembrane sensor
MKKRKLNITIITKYLLNEPDNNEKQMINKLINDDELSRKEFEAYLDVWEKSANVKDYDNIDAQKDWNKVRSKMNLKPSIKHIPLRNYLLRVAAILVLAFGLALFFNQLLKVNNNKSKAYNYYETAALNEVKKVVLTDSTIINLNRNSKIIQNDNYGITNRDIILEGEAFFEVAKNPKLPFKVYTLNSTVEVLGTSFNIKCDSQKVIVGVVTGKVAFYQSKNSKNRVELVPENTGIYKVNENNFITKNYLNPNSIAWHTGKLVFRHTPENEVFKVIAEYFNKDLIIQTNTPLNSTFTGDFEKQSLDEMIEIINLTRTSKLEIVTTDNSIIVSKR